MKFNVLKRKAKKIRNYEGAAAYVMTPELELYSAVATSALQDTFYEKQDLRLARLQNLIAKNDKEYVAKLAAYARQKMYLRSVPMVMAVELAKQTSGNSLVRRTVNAVVQRADEITELLAYYQNANSRTGTKKLNKISKQLQKGLGDVFNKFDEYQFAKYNRAAEVRLKDALFLVHPKAKDDKQQEIFNKIASDKLDVAYTWESELSALGQLSFQNVEEKVAAWKAKWEELIDSGKLGYMALMRNLRNILEAGVSKIHVQKVCQFLADPGNVAKSRQLPFRFLAAYREIKVLNMKYVTMILNALEDALQASVCNLKGFDEDQSILIACDVSASMQQAISPKSRIMLYDIGLILGMMLQSKCRLVITGMFGDKWKIINMPNRSILSAVEEFYRREGEVGYATNGYKVIDDLVNRNVVMDKVMIFTDCQMWNSDDTVATFERSWLNYKKVAPYAKLYLFDLAGYGQAPLRFTSKDVCLIAGWSDKIFDVLQSVEEGRSVVEQIKQYPI